MRILTRLLIVSLFLLSSGSLSAQRTPLIQADLAFSKGDYYDAAILYKKAYTKEKNKVKKAEIIYKVAESYRLVNDFRNQEVWYNKSIKAKYKDPIAILQYADALKYNGKYDEAIVQYTNYLKEVPSDPRGQNGITSCEQAQKWQDKPTRYKVENVSPINTKYGDFGAFYSHKDRRHLIFTSSRQESIGKNNDGGTGEKFQDLFETKVDKKGKWSSPKPLLEPANSNANDGSATMDIKGTDMYFTRCPMEKGKMGACEIYFTKRKGQTWDEPKLIPLNVDSSTVGQPALSADEMTLYFVSDMDGGQGGKDIWKTEYDKKTKEWGSPVNLGNVINTPEDEMFPYITSDNTLYFSSKGRIGMGGLDIFMSKLTENTWSEPVNMKYPINTSGDDFAFIIDETTGDRGYLSSNRSGGKGGDDIYSWELPPLIFTISGRVYDADTRANIENANIEMFGSDGTSIPFKTDKTGAYKFDLKPETSYKISATMNNYLNKYLEVSTVGLEQSKDFIGDFDFAMRSILRAIELPEIYYDLGKWDLRSESKKSLDDLLQTLNENPTIVIEIGSHTDSRPIPMTNDTLSSRRAQSVVNYLIKNGIAAERLTYKGYAAEEPRRLESDLGSFKQGDVLNTEFINGLKTTKLKEEAHQLNRRTEFKVLRTNYVVGQDASENLNYTPSEKTTVEETDSIPVEDITTPTEVEVQEAAPSKSGPGEVYTCQKSDTYVSIAKNYGISVRDLKILNDLRSEQIAAGMQLKVDPKGDYTDFDKKFYTLEKGEMTYKVVAKKLNLKDSDLKKLNPGITEKYFRIGKKIRVAE
ncbi:MAG TPA: OmpA family protein [Bacteroidia bacterium]|nr:OmpA family protein [Bacteroidia bacterium]